MSFFYRDFGFICDIWFLGEALSALKTSLNASGTQLSNWNQNQVNPCNWYNVNCDPDNNVISV